jgi:hypothetical protein
MASQGRPLSSCRILVPRQQTGAGLTRSSCWMMEILGTSAARGCYAAGAAAWPGPRSSDLLHKLLEMAGSACDTLWSLASRPCVSRTLAFGPQSALLQLRSGAKEELACHSESILSAS